MKSKIFFISSVFVGLVFINAGLDKYLHYMPVPRDIPEKMKKAGMAFTEIGWLMPMVGAAEILGGLLLILPRTRALGAIVLVPVLTGILLATINFAPSGLPMVFILTVIMLWVIFENRAKYLPIISS